MIPNEQKKHILRTHISKGRIEREEWDRYTAWYLGEDANASAAVDGALPNTYSDANEGEEFRLDTNYPYAFIDTMIANVCPTNPLITLNARGKDRQKPAAAREALVNDTFRRDKMHAKSWDMAAYCSLVGRAFSKTFWSRKHRRPMTKVINPRCIFFDPTVDWDETRYVIEAVRMTQAEFEARLNEPDPALRFNMPENQKPTYTQIPTWLVDRGGIYHYNTAAFEVFKWIVVYEFHDLVAGTMCFMLEDCEKPLWEGPRPFQYIRNPYSKVVFNKNMIDEAGVSDIKLISKIQERLNEIDTLEMWWTHTAIPIAVINESAFDNAEEAVTGFQNCTGPGDVWRVALREQVPLQAAVDFTRPPQAMPQFDKMREVCTKLIEFILGIPSYARGAYGGAEVATELALVDTATRTRNGRRIRVLEDWTTDVASKTLAIWREFFPKQGSLDLRGRGPFDDVVVNRFEMAFPEDITGSAPSDDVDFDEDFYYEFEAISYSPTENHRLVQLQKLQQFLEVLANNPNVNQGLLFSKLLELLGMEEIRQDPATAPPPPPGAPPGSPVSPGQLPPGSGGLPSGTPADTISTGGLPQGLQDSAEAILPPGSRQMADQAKAI